MRKIYIVLPAYNEEESIGKLLDRIKATMDEVDIVNFEVLVVNDGSVDKTLEIVEQKAATMPIHIVNHEINQGLGATIRDGLHTASAKANKEDIIITMDADDTHTPGLIPRMINKIREGCDVVVASRYQIGSQVVGLSRFRRFLSFAASWLFRILLPIPGIKDFTCGYRAYRAEAIQKAIVQYGDQFVDQEGFQCMVDILLKLRRMDIIFGEVPFILRYDFKEGESKMDVKKTVRNTLSLILKRLGPA